MKTNPTIITRPLVTAVLLLTIVAGLSSCETAEPVKPKSAYGPILPPDTLTVDPNNPTPTSTVPIIKLSDPQPE